jgi:hypothetical protein
MQIIVSDLVWLFNGINARGSLVRQSQANLRLRSQAGNNISAMPNIFIPFLPKLRLMQYLQTQCQVDRGSSHGTFINALDLDLSHIDQNASVEAVVVTNVLIAAETVVVPYDVHYRVFDGCKGVDLKGYLDKKVTGIRTPNGWEFLEFVMTPERSTSDEF